MHFSGPQSVRGDQHGHLGDRIASAAAILAILGVGKGAQDGQEKRPELRGELHLAAFPRLQRPAQAAVSCTAIKTR